MSKMIQPIQKEETFLRDLEMARALTDQLHIWWLGQSGFLLQWQDTRLLFDPYLSDSLTRKYVETDKPHIRMTEQVVQPGALMEIDVVTSSHNHTDHLDGETLLALFGSNPGLRLVLPEANVDFAADRLGGYREEMIGLAEGIPRDVVEIQFTAIPAAHEERTPAFQGFVAKIGPWTVYHSGDTLLFDGLMDVLAPFEIDVAFLPINGRAPERRVAGNLNGEEAAQLAKSIGAGLVIPCHYEMFTFNTASPDRFEATCKELGQAFRRMRAGERLSLESKP